MKFKLSTLVLTTGLSFSTLANANNITLCDPSGCRNGGSATATSNHGQTKYPGQTPGHTISIVVLGRASNNVLLSGYSLHHRALPQWRL